MIYSKNTLLKPRNIWEQLLNMSLKEKWKEFGKDTGKAFANFGKSMGKTAKVAFTDDENKVEENGHTELGNSWHETGKSFGEAGKALGKAAQGTGQKIFGEEEKKDDAPMKEAGPEVDLTEKEEDTK